jgi:hypothetical protein
MPGGFVIHARVLYVTRERSDRVACKVGDGVQTGGLGTACRRTKTLPE